MAAIVFDRLNIHCWLFRSYTVVANMSFVWFPSNAILLHLYGSLLSREETNTQTQIFQKCQFEITSSETEITRCP